MPDSQPRIPAPPAGVVTPVASVPSCAAPAGNGSAAKLTGCVAPLPSTFTAVALPPSKLTDHVPLCVAATLCPDQLTAHGAPDCETACVTGKFVTCASAPPSACSAGWFAAVAAPVASGNVAAETATVPLTATAGVPVSPTLHGPFCATACVAGKLATCANAPPSACSAGWFAAVAAPAASGAVPADTATVPLTPTVGVPVSPTLHAPLCATDCAE